MLPVRPSSTEAQVLTGAAYEPSPRQLSRNAYRRARTIRSVLIALLSTAVVVGVVVFLVGRSSGWPRFRNSFLDLRRGWNGLPALLQALWVNVQIMLISEAVILVVAALLATMRTLRGPVF